MGCTKGTLSCIVVGMLVLVLPLLDGATVKDIFTIQDSPRVPRDNKYFPARYGLSSSSSLSKVPKPEDAPEAHQPAQTPVEKRCIRCESDYWDSRYPYESRSRYDDKRYRDRYDYDYDRRYDRYDDRDRYYDRYDKYDRRPDSYDRYDRDRYDRDRYSDRDRYDRYDNRDRYYDRYYDRGVGYDNRGYDYRERYDRDGYRPWDETYRGSSGWDGAGRGYYFATGKPDSGSGYWGGSSGGGYASNWNYLGGRDDYRDRGQNSFYNRSKEPYDGYRSTSYLYGRPSSTTTNKPNDAGDGNNNGVTQNPQQDNSSG